MSVCVYVCLLDTSVRPTKTAEPIEILFGLWTHVDPKETCMQRKLFYENIKYGDRVDYGKF